MLKFITRVLLFFILSIGLYAGNGLSQKHLVSVSPEALALGQHEDTVIKIVFNEPIVSKSVKKHTIRLRYDKQKIEGVTTLVGENTLHFVPNEALRSGTYKVIVKRVKLDLAEEGTNQCTPKSRHQRFVYWLCSLFYDNPADCPLCQYVCGNNGNKVKTKKIKYTFIVDETPPVITLNGENNINLIVGDDYEELGASAVDDLDGNVSVSISGEVDTSTEGNYTVTYTAVDKSGNSDSVTRNTSVVKPREEMGLLPRVEDDKIRDVRYGNLHILGVHKEEIEELSLLKLCNNTKCWTVIDKNNILAVSNEKQITDTYKTFEIAKLVFKDFNQTIDAVKYSYGGKDGEIKLKEKLYFSKAIIDVLYLNFAKEVSEYLVTTAVPYAYRLFIPDEDYRHVFYNGVIVEIEKNTSNNPGILVVEKNENQDDEKVVSWDCDISIVSFPPRNFINIEEKINQGNIGKAILNIEEVFYKNIKIYIPTKFKNIAEQELKEQYPIEINGKRVEYDIEHIDDKVYILIKTDLSHNNIDFRNIKNWGI